jgi:hypothetical protein
MSAKEIQAEYAKIASDDPSLTLAQVDAVFARKHPELFPLSFSSAWALAKKNEPAFFNEATRIDNDIWAGPATKPATLPARKPPPIRISAKRGEVFVVQGGFATRLT